MNTLEIINIEKYAHALNALVGMDIGYLGDSDENVNAIVEVIRVAKKLENRVKELEAEKDILINNTAKFIKDYAREIFEEAKNIRPRGHTFSECYDDWLEQFTELEKKYVEGEV